MPISDSDKLQPLDLDALLQKLGLVPDQRMRLALKLCTQNSTFIHDYHLIEALLRLNAIHARHPYAATVWTELSGNLSSGTERIDHQTGSSLNGHLVPSMIDIFRTVATSSRILGTRIFLSAWAQYCIKYGGSRFYRSFGLDWLLTDEAASPSGGGPGEMPELQSFLESLVEFDHVDDDFQYVLAFEGDRIVFRIASVLGDHVKEDHGKLVPQRSLLFHARDAFGLFANEEIEELEYLINSLNTAEREFQSFFERHPHFLRRDDYREVHPHVCLSHNSAFDLIPDFILTDRRLAKAALVELKLPRAQLVRRQRNRDRFANAVMEARAQLLCYREWFRSSLNRHRLRSVIGMDILEPRMIVIIGRSSEFVDAVDRQRLAAQVSDIEVVTYDDIVETASRRRVWLT